ncbi:hypothetical protein C1H46_025358 [Malus baccata]|uniref:Uncharacterized protein n=1 Tax=Malus baccata TaxID=106549 RepID=A0A540LRF2_MALBA|nr:hypothetical protein C1H46_025358 [Malus baccata]
MKNEVSPSFQQQPERLSSDSLPESSPSGSGYHALLDKLVVLEGLVDPSELQPQGCIYRSLSLDIVTGFGG